MKLLSIVLLTSVFAMPVASLADQNPSNQIAAESKGCPFAKEKQPAQNQLDAKNVAPVIHTDSGSKATNAPTET